MKKHIKKIRIAIFVVIAILAIATIAWQVSIKVAQNRIASLKEPPLIQYKIISEIDTADIYNVVVVINNKTGLEKVTYIHPTTNEEITINANGKIKVAFDFKAEEGKEYTFKIKKKGEVEKNESKIFEVPAIEGKYTNKKGIYVNEPDLTGFLPEYTRYLNCNQDGFLEPGNWIDAEEPNDWYDYKNKKWANIYIEKGGVDSYFVWIPRYCFKLDQENQVSDVKFINMKNNHTQEDGTVITWADLKAQGYQIPDAFSFYNEDNEKVRMPGYWTMKYESGDIISPSILNYEMVVARDKITVKNIRLNTGVTSSNPITKYTVSLNGEIKYTGPEINNVELTGVKSDNNIVNVTGLNANNEIVGSMTKVNTMAKVNEPELSAFNQDTTFYVTYDQNGVEHSTIPISKPAPENWYEYSYGEWANIVTRVDGYECYYVWIPRYQFKLDQINQTSEVLFIEGTGTETKEGFQIPEAFSQNGQELTGYWVMKYEVGDEFGPKFDAGVTATSSSIRVKGITGSGVAENQVYKYYLNGDYKGQSTTATDEFEYTGLNTDTKYTVLVEIRNSSDDYIGTIVKQITTVAPNAPVLSGFNSSNTYYVTYDETGTNATVGNKISSGAPSGWYDYSRNRWANIVQTNGTVENGQITNATVTIYYVWIPRYEFRLPTSQYAQSNIGKSEVRFVGTDITNDNCSVGYQVPEAFSQNGQELPGYWIMKYEAGN